MEKIAVFPGSFDPVTVGHEHLVRRALPLFDKLIVAIGNNSEKQTWLTVAERRALLETLFADEPKVAVATYEGLTTDFCRACGARFLVRGLRTAWDFEYEKTIAAANRQLDNGIESVFLCASDELSSVQSSVVREMLKYGKPADGMVPVALRTDIQRLAKEKGW